MAINKSELQEVYDRYPVDEYAVEYICEAYTQVNNLDNIINEMINNIKRELKLTEHGKFYIVGDVRLYKGYNKPGLTIYNDRFSLSSRYIKNAEFLLDLWILDEKYYKDYSDFSKNDVFLEAYIKTDVYLSGNPAAIGLRIPGFQYKGNKYIGLNIFQNVIAHEITHYYQIISNPVYLNPRKALEYNTQYSNINTQRKTNDDEFLKKISHLMYYLTYSEISAECNSLSIEMKKLNADRNNYKEVFNKTPVGKEYNKMLSIVKEFDKYEEKDWQRLIDFTQAKQFFKSESTLGKTKDLGIFKKYFLNYIKKHVDYANEKYRKAMYYAIDAYKGKNDDVIYSTHNKNISGQPID
jgi:hypothetical protein